MRWYRLTVPNKKGVNGLKQPHAGVVNDSTQVLKGRTYSIRIIKEYTCLALKGWHKYFEMAPEFWTGNTVKQSLHLYKKIYAHRETAGSGKSDFLAVVEPQSLRSNFSSFC